MGKHGTKEPPPAESECGTRPGEGASKVTSLPGSAFAPKRAIISGVMDELTGRKREFRLLLKDGQGIRGRLPPGELGQFLRFFNKNVTVDGVVRFRHSGTVSQIAAAHIQQAGPGDHVWEHPPEPDPRSVEDQKPKRTPPPGSTWLDLIRGKWPGDETDSDIRAALEELS